MRFHDRIPLLLCFLIVLSYNYVAYANSTSVLIYGETVKPVREVVYDPLPSKPKLGVYGSNLNITISADESARDWRIFLVSRYDSFEVEVVNSIYDADEKLWTITIRIPENIPGDLYDLKVTFVSDVKGEFEYLQYKCVNVSSSPPRELIIAHLSDTHLPYGADVVARAVYELSLLRPSVVVITGDLVDVGTIGSAWKYMQHILFRGPLKSMLYILPGNHDHSGDDALNYRKYCGPLYYHERLGDFHFIAFDTSLEGYIKFDQLDWAESILSRIGNGVKIFAFHHPLFSWGPSSITGSWREIEEFSKYLYSSWREQIDYAKRLLRLIEEYNVTLILSGHIHTEHYVVYNNHHHFEVNLPAGGGLREGDYWSFRLLKIDVNGNVKLFTNGNISPTTHPSSYPLGMINYYYSPYNDGSSNAVSIYIMNNLSSPITPLIEFAVSSNVPLEQYSFYPESPSKYEVFNIGQAYVFRFRVTVPPKGEYYVTLTSSEDNSPPQLDFNYDLIDNSTLELDIVVRDLEWGAKNLTLLYKFDGEEEWNQVYLTPILEVNKDVIKTVYDSLFYQYTLTIPEKAYNVTLRLKAFDFAGNLVDKSFTVTIRQPEKPPSPPSPPPQPPSPPPPQPFPFHYILIVVVIVIVVMLTVLVKLRGGKI